MKQMFAAFASGLIFAIGLGLAGMTQPSKVVGFLDLFGDWDPSLAFVMIGAIAVNAVAYRIVAGRTAPLLGGIFQIPTRRDIDKRLVFGAALFGLGWGLMGYCPGPGIVSLASTAPSAVLFVASMFAGMYLFTLYDARVSASAPSKPIVLQPTAVSKEERHDLDVRAHRAGG